VVNLGANWAFSWSDDPYDRGRRGLDFILEMQARMFPQDYLKVLRAQWVGHALGEQQVDSTKEGSGGWWNVMALFEKKLIVAAAKPVQLSALGQELGEANESAATRATAVEKATITVAAKKIVIGSNGVITVPAAACTGSVQPMRSFLGGLQTFCGGTFSCTVDVTRPGRYQLAARVVTVHDEGQLQVVANNAKDPIDMVIPYTCGLWQDTPPVEVTLILGKNVLNFSKPTSGFSFKDFTLTPK